MEAIRQDLVAWANDPDHFLRLGWPFHPSWVWGHGASVALWHAGRLLALATRQEQCVVFEPMRSTNPGGGLIEITRMADPTPLFPALAAEEA